jgi:hypothetical protein
LLGEHCPKHRTVVKQMSLSCPLSHKSWLGSGKVVNVPEPPLPWIEVAGIPETLKRHAADLPRCR